MPPQSFAITIGGRRQIGYISRQSSGRIAAAMHGGEAKSFEDFVHKIIAAGIRIAAIALAVTLAGAGAAFAEEAFPLTGTYMQNVPCKGDGTDAPALQVKISPQEIVSNVGVCTILDTKQDAKSVTAHVECKFPAGPLIGDITFTPLPDKTIKFVDRDNTYNAILHRCPD